MMDLTVIHRIFWRFFPLIGLAVQLVFASAAANLTCSVTKLPRGLFMYQLSRPPSSPSYSTDWEDENKTKIANSINFTQLVQNRTDQSIILKACRDYLHYTNDCSEGFEEAYCRFNCSGLSAEDAHHPNINSTLICVFGNWCPEPLTLGLVIASIVVLAAGALVCILWKRRRDSVAVINSYVAADADEEIKMVGVEIVNETAAEQG